ncbi:trehalose-phosphatase [Marinicaulis aureus]|uniref:Trehalose 6-phosphate phosphatase n=1 Tax=Hyphococcus aureus TaxID=2666033 RepID=A0ABW1KV13_9PROT
MNLPPPPLPLPGAALFLDFDGTLAPLQSNPDAVILPEGGGETLRALAAKLGGALAVLSGRDIRDLSKRIPDNLWRAGGHGLEVCAPGDAPEDEPNAAPPALVDALSLLAAGVEGARLEPKGEVLALHYRAAPDAGAVLQNAMEKIIAGIDGYILQPGKMVLEAKPVHANKGLTLMRFLERQPFAGLSPVMVGDDATDEDAMAEAKAAGGYGVKIGTGDTHAAYGLASPADVWRWLEAAAQ